VFDSRPERLVPIAERYGVDPDAALDNIVVARAVTSVCVFVVVVSPFLNIKQLGSSRRFDY
jgi:hypothetical protein